MGRPKRRAASKAKPKSPLKLPEEEPEREEGDSGHAETPGGQETQNNDVDVEENEPNRPEGEEAVEEEHGGFHPSQGPGNRVEAPAEGEEEPGDDGGWWTIAKEDKLIDNYQAARHLWDKMAPGFKTRNKKDIALSAWSKELGIPSK